MKWVCFSYLVSLFSLVCLISVYRSVYLYLYPDGIYLLKGRRFNVFVVNFEPI